MPSNKSKQSKNQPKRKHWKMPTRLWRLPRKEVNWQQKRLLAYIWWCAPNGMRLWNCRLAKTYSVSERTIRRWLAVLKSCELIAIRYGDGMNRIVFPRYQARRKPKGLVKPDRLNPEAGKAAIDEITNGLANAFSTP